MKRFAVFLDVDNTLYVDGDVSPGIRRAIKAAQQKGHLFFLNTGRSFAFLPPPVMQAVAWDGVVAGIGADVRCGERVLYNRIAPMAALERVTRYFRDAGRVLMMEGENMVVSFGQKTHDLVDLDTWEEFTRLDSPRISKLTFPEVLSDEDCRVLLPDFTAIRHHDYTEAAIAGCNKATGMLKALEALDIPVARSIAMGDSHNDWDMLDAAGISVAMGNADAATKARCTVVSPDACDDGVAWAIEKYLL